MCRVRATSDDLPPLPSLSPFRPTRRNSIGDMYKIEDRILLFSSCPSRHKPSLLISPASQTVDHLLLLTSLISVSLSKRMGRVPTLPKKRKSHKSSNRLLTENRTRGRHKSPDICFFLHPNLNFLGPITLSVQDIKNTMLGQKMHYVKLDNCHIQGLPLKPL